MSIKFICTIFLVILVGCLSSTADMKANKLAGDFFQMTTSEQVNQFKNYSLDEQYEIFLFGNQVVHPPAIYLSRPFAEQGPIVVPFLKAKLKKTQKEVTIRDIVTVFSELTRLRLYDFSKDPNLMELLDMKTNKMNGIWKETTIQMLSEIRKSAKATP